MEWLHDVVSVAITVTAVVTVAITVTVTGAVTVAVTNTDAKTAKVNRSKPIQVMVIVAATTP